MNARSRLRTGCLTLLLAALLAVPLVQIVRAGQRLTIIPNLEVDARGYDSSALELARHPSLGAVPAAYPPGFVAIVALVYATVGHSIVAAKILLWLCLVVATIAAGLLARRLHGTIAAGWTAALLTASSPALQGYTTTLQYEVLVGALILGLIALALHMATRAGPAALVRGALILGVVMGFAMLVRESLVAFVPVFALFIAHRARRTTRVAVAALASAAVLVGAALPIVAWSAVQSRRAGHAMFIRDNVPGILPYGHNPYANGTWNDSLSGVGQPSGVAFIVAEPRRELWLLARKFLYFWGVLRDGWNVPRPAAVWAVRATGGLLPLDFVLPLARGGWLLLASIAACAAFRKDQWRDFWLLPAIVVALMTVHLVTVSSHRFAVPILPVVFVLVSGIIAGVFTRLRPAGIVAVALVAAAVVAMQARHWPMTYRLQATEVDGVHGENRREPDGRLVRFSDAARGHRVAFALYDEYLPSGTVIVRMSTRRGQTSLPGGTPVARARLFLLDGSVSCDTLVTLDELSGADRWGPVARSCVLPHDGTARLIVETFGRVDLSFSDVALRWTRG